MDGRGKTGMVGTRELATFLERLLSVRLVDVRREPCPYASSSPVEIVRARSASGRAYTMLFKNLSPAARMVKAWNIRPAHIVSNRREYDTYRRLLTPDRRLGTPRLFGGRVSRDGRVSWLFIEYIEGHHLWQAEGMKAWGDAAAWLARLHHAVDLEGMPRSARSFLLNYDRRFYRSWIERAVAFVPRNSLSRDRARDWDRLVSAYPDVVRALVAMPRTLIHGEFYPSNILVRPGVKGNATCPIDWEVAGYGPGAIDLAALTSGEWPERERLAMIARYHRAVQRLDRDAPSRERLQRDVTCCQLHLAVQMLGWAPVWKAPRAHRQDWLGVALGRARELGIL